MRVPHFISEGFRTLPKQLFGGTGTSTADAVPGNVAEIVAVGDGHIGYSNWPGRTGPGPTKTCACNDCPASDNIQPSPTNHLRHHPASAVACMRLLSPFESFNSSCFIRRGSRSQILLHFRRVHHSSFCCVTIASDPRLVCVLVIVRALAFLQIFV